VPDPDGSIDRFIKVWFEIDGAEIFSFGFGG
jgi:hypothetical protein